MTKIERRKITKREWEAVCAEIKTCLLRLPRRKDIVTLLFDLLTESELIMLARRLRIARGLFLGDTFHEIRRNHGVGFDTVEWIHRWLNEKVDDYRKFLPPVLERAAEEGKKAKRIGKIPLDPYSFRAIRRRYPAHFLLFNLILGDPDEYEVEP